MAKKISDVVYPELKSTQKLSFTGDNFLIWKLKLSFILSDHQLPHLLNPKPQNNYPTCNSKNDVAAAAAAAKHLILETLDDNLFLEFSEYPTPSSIMEALLNRFDSRLKAFRIILLRRYKDHRMPLDSHINQHIFRMRAMAKELEYTGVNIPDEMQAVVLLNSLPDDWDDDVERLMMELDGTKEKDFSFDYVSRRLKMVREVRLLRKLNKCSNLKNKFKGSCFNCGKRGYHQSDCPDQDSSKQESSLLELLLLADPSVTLTEIIYHQFKTDLRIDYKGKRYSTWKGDLFHVLKYNHVEYVLKDPKPSGPTDTTSDEDAQLYNKWQVDDFTCRHLILGAMEDDVFLSFHDYPTAKTLMDALEAFFSSRSAARKLVLLKTYMNNHMSDETPISNHIAKMDWMANKLGIAGVNIPNEMQSVVLLDSLPMSWGDRLTMLNVNLSMEKGNGLSLDNIRKRIRHVGLIREVNAQEDDSSIPDNCNRKKKRVVKGKCYSCGRLGHYQSDCPDQR